MKRAEYSEYLCIRKYRKEDTRPIMWHIRPDYSPALKQKIDGLLREFRFYPTSVREPEFWRGDGDFIIYSPYENEAEWLSMTTASGRARGEAAIRA